MKQSNLLFNGYIVDKIDFKLNPNFKKQDTVNVKIGIEKNIQINENTITTTLNAKLFENEENAPFILFISLIGNFTLTGDYEEEFIDNIAKTNTVAILFPYLRALITSITANCNVPPVVLPAFNVSHFFDNKKEG